MAVREAVYKSCNGHLVILSDQAASKLSEYRQMTQACTEAGGVLIGERRGKHIVITKVSEPAPPDKRSRFSFERKGNHHQNFINECHTISNGTLQYLGEWHTHPEKKPSPSSLDLSSWSNNIDDLKPMVVLIVGTESLWIAKTTTKCLEELQEIL